MSAPHTKKMSVTEAQATELAGWLFGPAGSGIHLTAENAEWDAIAETPAPISAPERNDTHPTDEQLIDYAARDLDLTAQAQVETHLGICAECFREVGRLRSLSEIWTDETRVQRLQDRVLTILNTSPQLRPAAPPAVLAASVRAALQALIGPRRAYAEGQDDHSEPVEFYITDEGAIVDTLAGTLQRKNDEYYVRVQPRRPEDRARFGDRTVRIMLSDTGKPDPILQRTIDVGVVVLLGTALPLTDTCHLTAQLLPSGNVGEPASDARQAFRPD